MERWGAAGAGIMRHALLIGPHPTSGVDDHLRVRATMARGRGKPPSANLNRQALTEPRPRSQRPQRARSWCEPGD